MNTISNFKGAVISLAYNALIFASTLDKTWSIFKEFNSEVHMQLKPSLNQPSFWSFLIGLISLTHFFLYPAFIWQPISPERSSAEKYMLKISSGNCRLDLILLIITSGLKIFYQHIWRRVVGSVLINNSPSNIFPILLLLVRFLSKRVRLPLVTVSINWLNIRAVPF